MASEQLLFFEKNKADPNFFIAGASTTASENSELSDLAVNRKNTSAWQTDDSTDAANTTYTLDFGRVVELDSLILIGHNFKDYDIEYFDGAIFKLFTLVTGGTTSFTGNTSNESFHETVKVVDAERVRITIKATFVVDDAKILTQFITTEKIGQLKGFPVMGGIRVGRDTSATEALEGLANIIDRQGGYRTTLAVSNYTLQADLDIIDLLFNKVDGFLFWPCGGDDSQFIPLVEGYRFKDIFVSRFVGQFRPNKNRGIYNNGIKFRVLLRQVLR